MLRVALLLTCFASLTLWVASTTPLEGRIVGGNDVSITKHPYQVSLRLRSCEACAYIHECGGSLYDEHTVITAAHCLYGYVPEQFVVVAGSDLRNGAGGFISRVKKVVLHEKYNASITDYDVGLIFLAGPPPINNLNTATIPLASARPADGALATVSGWGKTTQGGIASFKLQEVYVPIVSHEQCTEAYEFNWEITESMLCAGLPKGGKDACQGDSGGPLVLNGELIGIVSWAYGCALPGYPGVYVNIAALRAWIEDTVKANSRIQ